MKLNERIKLIDVKKNHIQGSPRFIVRMPPSSHRFPRTLLQNPHPILTPLPGPISRPVTKPVIYLYPKKSMDISIQINLKENSKFTTIYPKFNENNSWKVYAQPNGNIFINNRIYPYLFWEADSYVSQDINEGFIVKDEEAEEFLEEKLKILGLNNKEKTDFIIYWLPIFIKNKLSLCTFQTKKFFDNFELNINPKPDSLIRIFISIKKLNNPINIKEQKLEYNERKGFTVIEWGGSKL